MHSLSFKLTGKSIFNTHRQKAILHIAASLDFELTGDTAATAWSKTTWTDLVQTNQTNALRQTRVKIMYSTTGIYCLFWCEDPTITATLQKDFEDLYNEDVVEFFSGPTKTIPCILNMNYHH